MHSPYADATIKNIDISKPLKVPGVVAAVRAGSRGRRARMAADLPRAGQADGLATGKTLFQYQKSGRLRGNPSGRSRRRRSCAGRVRTAQAGVTTPFDAMEGRQRSCCARTASKKTNHIYHWEVGSKNGDRKKGRSRAASTSIKERIWFQRCHPARSNRAVAWHILTRWDACSFTHHTGTARNTVPRCRS